MDSNNQNISNVTASSKDAEIKRIKEEISVLLRNVKKLEGELKSLEESKEDISTPLELPAELIALEQELKSILPIPLEAEKKYSEDLLKMLEVQLKTALQQPKENESRINQKITIRHISIPEFKLIAVLNNLQEDNTAFNRLSKWFSALPVESFDDIESLNKVYLSVLDEIGIPLMEDLSFSSVIFTGDKTIVAKFGKSPIYKYNNGEIEPIEQLSQESLASIVMDNNDYQSIVIFSNGNEEDLEDDRIKIITKSTDRDKLALELLEPQGEELGIKK